MATYAQRIGTYAGPGPLETSGVTCYAFLLQSSASGALQGMCDRFFNGPSGGDLDIRPLINNVVYTIMPIERAQSTDPEGRKVGWFPEVDVGFWLPVARYQRVLGIPLITGLFLAPLALFVDKAIGVVAGREVWGFPKQIGRFSVPVDTADPGPWSLWTEVTPVEAGEIVEDTLVEVTRTKGAKAPEDDHVASSDEEVLRMILDTFGVAEGMKQADVDFAPDLQLTLPSLPLLFLKQFRDGVETTGACYQAITRCTTTIGWKKAGILWGGFELEISDPYSHPLLADLGLQPTHPVSAALWAEFDATFGKAEVAWPDE